MSRLTLLRLVPFLAILTISDLVAAEQPRQRDSLEALRDAVALHVDPKNKDDLQFRRTNLEKHIRALGPADLGPALRLQEWHDEDRDEVIAAIDTSAREAVAKKLAALLRDALRKGDVSAKRAALVQIGELGNVRGSKGSALGSEFAPDVIVTLKDRDESVCRTGARALGKIMPPPKESAAALGELLAADDVIRRRAAAAGLATWVRTSAEAHKQGSIAEAGKPHAVAQAATAAVAVAARGTSDTDLQVRRLCLEAIRQAGIILDLLVRDPPQGRERVELGLVPDRKPGPAELEQLDAYVKAVQEERALLLPLEQALAVATSAVAGAAADPDATLSRAACETLEAMPAGRRRLLAKAALIAPFAKEKSPEDTLGPALRKVVPVLAKLTSHKDVNLRLASLYALEEFEFDAAPAAGSLVAALQDTDPFVRWAAVRALGKMAPREADKAVPALASVLTDENGDVRATAAVALERYGPEAKAAVPALGRAAGSAEAEMCVLAIRALAAIGPEAAPAVPALVKALAAPEAKVRFEAARTLARLGPAARPAADALNKALDDADADVRRTAAEALLAIR